jgi:metallophosphoesterase superfamily enzyme
MKALTRGPAVAVLGVSERRKLHWSENVLLCPHSGWNHENSSVKGDYFYALTLGHSHPAFQLRWNVNSRGVGVKI